MPFEFCILGGWGLLVLGPPTYAQVPYMKWHGTADPLYLWFLHPEIQPTMEAKSRDTEGQLYLKYSVVFFFSLIVSSDSLFWHALSYSCWHLLG